MKKILMGLIFSLFLVSGVFAWGVFVQNNTYNTSLPVISASYPAVWNMDNHLNIMLGTTDEYGECMRAYTWNSTSWVLNNTLKSGILCEIDSDTGRTTIFNFDGNSNLLLIAPSSMVGSPNSSSDQNIIKAYTWNGTSWDRNGTLENGLNDNMTVIGGWGVMRYYYPKFYYWNYTDKIRFFLGYYDYTHVKSGFLIKEWNGTYWDTKENYHQVYYPSTINWTATANTHCIPSYVRIGDRDYLILSKSGAISPHYFNGTNWIPDYSPFVNIDLTYHTYNMNFESFNGSVNLLQGDAEYISKNTYGYYYTCISNWTSSSYDYCVNSINYRNDVVWYDNQICDEGNYSFNITTYPSLPYLLTNQFINCFNSSNNETTYVYNDTKSCGYSVVNYTYPVLIYAFTQQVNDCLNASRVRRTYWYNDTSNCGYYYNTTNTTDCFVAVCSDANCSTSYKCQVGSPICVFDYNETYYNCCNDCGVPDEFYRCDNNVLVERKTYRSLTEIGQGTGYLFLSMGKPLAVLLILLSMAVMVGVFFYSVSRRV